MRLIDADALIEEMNTSQKQPTSDENIEGYCEGWNDLADIINSQPTAYDVDAVVEELQKAESVKCYGSRNSGNYMIPLADAIEIVKAGGVK